MRWLSAMAVVTLVVNVVMAPMPTADAEQGAPPLEPAASQDPAGLGFWENLLCAGCLAGAGIGLATGGIAAALAWAASAGSGLAAIGCTAACAVTLQDMGVL